MDIRSIPYPADLKVISTPDAHYEGWCITIEAFDRINSIIISRTDDQQQVASKLRELANKVEEA